LEIEENKAKIKKHCKWISNYLTDDIINQNSNQKLIDYTSFKNQSSSEEISIKDINPEVVLEKYFKILPPFQKSKPCEFKDAFFLEAVYQFSKTNIEYSGYVIISNDNGIKSAIDVCENGKIKCMDSIQELVDMIINYGKDKKQKLEKYLKKYDFSEQLEKNCYVSYSGIEEERIDVEKVESNGIFSLEVINVTKEKITITCDLGICLIGNFSCLDYDNSYYSNEEGDYIYRKYKHRKWLGYICQTVIDIHLENEIYSKAEIIELPEIDIDYESFYSIEDYIERDKK